MDPLGLSLENYFFFFAAVFFLAVFFFAVFFFAVAIVVLLFNLSSQAYVKYRYVIGYVNNSSYGNFLIS